MSDLTELQQSCEHLYDAWTHRGETHNSTDHYSRVCLKCLCVETYAGKTAPEGYNEPQTVVHPAASVMLKDKLGFLINLASAVVKQRPGLPVCYIAGKVTGLPAHEVKRKFERRKYVIEAMGFIALNPCDFISPNEDWQTAMRMASTLLMMSEHINLLPDWQDSEGAKLEFGMATKFGINLIIID